MSHSPHDQLLNDTLHPDALAESLAATRRAAGRRRVTRRAARAGAVGALLAAAGLLFVRPPRSLETLAPSPPRLPAPAAQPPLQKPHQLIATRAGATAVIVRTTSHSEVHSPVTRSVEMVSTRTASPSIIRASEDDLFAAAGSRPAALRRLADGSARWIWLDSATLAR